MNYTHYTKNLHNYSNKTCSAAQFGGNRELADIAGKLFDRYGQLDEVADHHSYENEKLNQAADEAYALFDEFMMLFGKSERIAYGFLCQVLENLGAVAVTV